MAFRRVADAGDLPPGALLEVEIEGRRIALANVDGELHAMDAVCPHNGGPLGHGALHGRMVVCPWHAWEFDCTTGAYDRNPEVRQTRFAIKLKDGAIWIDPDTRA